MTVSMKQLPALTLACAFIIGCGQSPPPVTSQESDPIQEAIVEKATKQAPAEVPPGYTVNSGGQLVKTAEATEDSADQ
jgi:hypothetical protein